MIEKPLGSHRDAMNKGVRHLKFLCRALLFVCVAFLAIAPAWSDAEYRVAAVITTERSSMALVEDASGKQDWYRVGDTLGGSQVSRIDADGIALVDANGESRLYLREELSRARTAYVDEEIPPPRYVSRSFQFIGLLSRIDAVRPGRGHSSEQAVARTLNEILGLADQAKITAVDMVEVSSAAEARSELMTRLLQDEPIRIAIDDAYTKMLYVVPDR